MNERIRELYRQAHSVRYYDGDPALDGNPPTVYWQGEVSAQRFAELIVKKCGEIAVFGDPRYSAQHNIHVYFGVESR